MYRIFESFNCMETNDDLFCIKLLFIDRGTNLENGNCEDAI